MTRTPVCISVVLLTLFTSACQNAADNPSKPAVKSQPVKHVKKRALKPAGKTPALDAPAPSEDLPPESPTLTPCDMQAYLETSLTNGNPPVVEDCIPAEAPVLILLRYTNSASVTHTAVATISGVSNAINQQVAQGTLHDISLTRSSWRKPPQDLPKDSFQKTLLADTTPIQDTEQARLYIKLTRLFMGASQRDAAYICADNARRHLAASVHANQLPPDEATALSKELDRLDADLRLQMPFTV